MNKAEQAAYYRAYRERRRKAALEFLGGKCVDCGTSENLEFDHIKPGMRVTKLIDYRWERVLQELRKCELRCTFCHRKRHGQREIG